MRIWRECKSPQGGNYFVLPAWNNSKHSASFKLNLLVCYSIQHRTVISTQAQQRNKLNKAFKLSWKLYFLIIVVLIFFLSCPFLIIFSYRREEGHKGGFNYWIELKKLLKISHLFKSLHHAVFLSEFPWQSLFPRLCHGTFITPQG